MRARLAGLAALYFAQGIPLGIAAEYLPVALRQEHASYKLIAAVGWLQLPWTLKVLWARAGDAPALRAHARRVVLALQAALAAVLALYAVRPLAEARALWLGLTGLAALVAATQDVFVDGLAVRTLGERERGLGNTAQVGAYRLGMVAGGAGLLSLGGVLGERVALLALAGVTLVASAGVLLVAEAPPEGPPSRRGLGEEVRAARATLASMARVSTRRVLVVAFTFKLGLHAAAALLKPVLVDGGWSKERIGALAVTVGTVAGVVGSLAGGVLHARIGERRALAIACGLQAVACAPLVLLVGHADRVSWVTAALVVEHGASGLGTTVLFAALMGATRPSDAALQFTVLSTANAVSLAAGSSLAGVLADAVGPRAVFALGAVGALAAGALLPGFHAASRALREAHRSAPAAPSRTLPR